MSHKSKGSALKLVSANDLLGSTLAALDSLITEAQTQTQQGDADSNTVRRKRQRGVGDVLSVMAEPHFCALQALVVAHGLQLMPSLDAIVRLVLLGVSSPAITSNSCWELAAVLGSHFRAGAVRILDELMELLLREKPPFLLAAPCILGVVAESGENGGDADTNARSPSAAAENVSKVVRNLRAFEDLLLSVGPFLSTSTMQRAALRFAQEVVLSGVLDVPPPHTVADGGLQQEREHTASPVRFSVEVELQPVCVDVLTAFLLLCRPLPSVVSASAVRVVKELPARTVTPRGRPHRQSLLRAVARLSVTLTALRHPYALPFYLPPKDIVEVSQRVAENPSSAGGGAAAANGIYPLDQKNRQPSAFANPSENAALQPSVAAAAGGGGTRVDTSSSPSSHASPPFSRPGVVGSQPQKSSATPKSDGKHMTSPAVQQQQQQQQQHHHQKHERQSTSVRPQSPVAFKNDVDDDGDDDDDDLPDIDMED